MQGQNDQDSTASDPRVTLDFPLARGTTTVTHVDLRRPRSGELRGVALADLLNMDVASLAKVLPRITSPSLTEADVRNLDPADLVQFGMKVTDFLLPKSTRPE